MKNKNRSWSFGKLRLCCTISPNELPGQGNCCNMFSPPAFAPFFIFQWCWFFERMTYCGSGETQCVAEPLLAFMACLLGRHLDIWKTTQGSSKSPQQHICSFLLWQVDYEYDDANDDKDDCKDNDDDDSLFAWRATTRDGLSSPPHMSPPFKTTFFGCLHTESHSKHIKTTAQKTFIYLSHQFPQKQEVFFVSVFFEWNIIILSRTAQLTKNFGESVEID